MTLVKQQHDPLQRVFELTARQGLIPRDDSFPEIPTVADVRRLRRLLPEVWHQLPPDSKREIYQVFEQMLLSRIPPVQLLATIPHTIKAFSKLIRLEGTQGFMAYGRAIDMEMKALQNEVVSLWENEHPDFPRRVEQAVSLSRQERGTRIQSHKDLKAALDDLF